MSGEIIEAGRSLDQVTQGIRVLTAQTVANMCQIGKLLTEAKAMVGHGGWGDYLEKEVSYSQSTANNFMRLFEEYGEFGPNSQTIANLGPTKAGLLLALPAEVREQFAEEHKDDSVRQLKAEIAKLTRRADQAEEDALAQKELLAIATEENGALKQRLDGIDADYKAQLDTVDRENDDLRQKLAEAEAKPAGISAEDADRLRQEGAEAAAEASRERVAAAEAKLKDAETRNAQLQSRLNDVREELRKLPQVKAGVPAAAANPNYGAFKASFEGLIPAFQQMCKYAVAAADTPEQVDEYRNAIKGLLLKLGARADHEVVWNK